MKDDELETEYCPDCAGSGENPWGTHGYCPTCGGSGEVYIDSTEENEDENL